MFYSSSAAVRIRLRQGSRKAERQGKLREPLVRSNIDSKHEHWLCSLELITGN